MTATQQRLADHINSRILAVCPDLARSALAVPEEMVTTFAPSPELARNIAEAERVNAAFRTMSHADLGELIRRSERLMESYTTDAANFSAQLLWLAFQAFKEGCIGVFRGGERVGMIGFSRGHQAFDLQLTAAFNGDFVIARADMQKAARDSKRALAKRVKAAHRSWAAGVTAERAALSAELDAERRAFTDERTRLREQHDMAIHGIDQAQAEASAAQRQVTALEQQLKLSRQQVTKLEYDIRKVKEGVLKPSAETLVLRERVTLLERQNKQLVSQPNRKDSQPTPPEVLKMPSALTEVQTDSLLEAMSLAAYHNVRHGFAHVQPGNRVATSDDLAESFEDWKREITDHRAYLRSLPSVQAVIGAAGQEAA